MIGVALGVAAAAFLPRVGRAASLDDDLSRLVVDIQAHVVPPQNPRPFVAQAEAATRSVDRGAYCTAVNEVGALRNHLRATHASGALTADAHGLLDGDAVRVLAGLLGSPRTVKCGGAQVAPVTSSGPEVVVVASDAAGLHLRLRLPAPRFTTRILPGGAAFAKMFMDGLGGSAAIGSPDVPSAVEHFGVPIGADVAVEVVDESHYTLPAIDLWPRQQEPSDEVPVGEPPFTIDQRAYATDSPYPAAPARVGLQGSMRGLRVGGVEIAGAQYNPAQKSLRVYTQVEVTIRFVGSRAGGFGGGDLRSPWASTSAAALAGALRNLQTILDNLNEPTPPWFCGEENLIVTSRALRPAAETLARSRAIAGIDSRIVEVGSGPGQIGTTEQEIQSFIRSELAAFCIKRPTYLTLLGDVANVPTFQAENPLASGTIATDLPFALADDEDLLPDLAVGRISVGDLQSASAVVAKIIGYEQDPPAEPSFYTSAAFMSMFDNDYGGTGSSYYTPYTELRSYTLNSETVRGALISNGYSVDRIYTESETVSWPTSSSDPRYFYNGAPLTSDLRKPTFAWASKTADVLSAWNAGRFIVFHRDHGDEKGWYHPDLVNEDIATLTNGALLPVAFAINCSSARTDYTTASFVERLLRHDGGGIVGALGDTRPSPTFANSTLALGFFDAIFPFVLPSYGNSAPVLRMGDVLNSGKLFLYSQYGLHTSGEDAAGYQAIADAELLLWHWIGDPTMPIWTRLPSRFETPRWSEESAGLRVWLEQPGTDGAQLTVMQDTEALGRAFLHGGEALVKYDKVPARDRNLYLSIDMASFVPKQVLIRPARVTCYSHVDQPLLALEATEVVEGVTVFMMAVTNAAVYPDEMFAATPDYGACGLESSPSRTWVEFYDQSDRLLQTECKVGAANQLQRVPLIIPARAELPDQVYVQLRDRACGLTYRSNMVQVMF